MENKKEFRLEKFELQFHRGYNFDSSVNRYEGKVIFTNEEGESFILKPSVELSFKILELINQKLAENTETLVNNIKTAIKNENDKI